MEAQVGAIVLNGESTPSAIGPRARWAPTGVAAWALLRGTEVRAELGPDDLCLV
jgi:hypothetical protein